MTIAEIGFGCGNFAGLGSQPRFYGTGNDKSSAFELLNICKDLGISKFDTANSYGGGQSETILGEWLTKQSSSYRQAVAISSKVGNPYGMIDKMDNPLSKSEILTNIERSLKRLRIDYISTYYVHELNATAIPSEVLEAFSLARNQGKIGTMGLSNVTKSDIKTFLGIMGISHRSLIRSVQNEFNLLADHDATSLIPWLKSLGIDYVGFSPLAGGMLTTNKIKTLAEAPRNSRLGQAPELYQRHFTETNQAKIRSLETLANQKGKSMAEAALEFCRTAYGVTQVLISPKSLTQFKELGLDVSSLRL
jgi:aryl-alcohol dehydrogenase-like predicted oxidoreductase